MQKPPMSYTEAIELLALNDNPADMNAKSVEESIAVQMVADIYRTNARALARTIVAYRKAQETR